MIILCKTIVTLSRCYYLGGVLNKGLGLTVLASKLHFWHIIGHAKPGLACERGGSCGCLFSLPEN